MADDRNQLTGVHIEVVYLHELTDGFHADRIIGDWFAFYNDERPHTALAGRTPAATYAAEEQPLGYDGQVCRLAHIPTGSTTATRCVIRGFGSMNPTTGVHLKSAAKLSNHPGPAQKGALNHHETRKQTGHYQRNSQRISRMH
ncbi:MAG: integrase core domain-containing protein [Pseudomonadota bacterium]|nr:integrase core domain-containing protein [Pseudomonadota bacterium]